MVQSYTELKTLEFIIKACRLKPYSYVFEERTKNIVLYRWWFDEFGNSLEITKKKRIRLIFNDLRLDKKKIISTDLYYNLPLTSVAKISKLVYVYAGKDEDLHQDCYLISFLGMDEHLRTYLYWFGEWQQISSLWIGMKHLNLLVANKDIKYFKTLPKSEDTLIPCHSARIWLSYLPANKDFLGIIKKQHELLLPILEGK